MFLRSDHAFDRVVLASFHEEIYDEFLRMKKDGEVSENFMFSPAYDAATEFYVLQLLGLDLFFDDKRFITGRSTILRKCSILLRSVRMAS